MQRLFFAGILGAVLGASYMMIRKKNVLRSNVMGPPVADTYPNPEY